MTIIYLFFSYPSIKEQKHRPKASLPLHHTAQFMHLFVLLAAGGGGGGAYEAFAGRTGEGEIGINCQDNNQDVHETLQHIFTRTVFG